jgi:hypothetical protein
MTRQEAIAIALKHMIPAFERDTGNKLTPEDIQDFTEHFFEQPDFAFFLDAIMEAGNMPR